MFFIDDLNKPSRQADDRYGHLDGGSSDEIKSAYNVEIHGDVIDDNDEIRCHF